MDEAHYSW
jgi:hypothetical protein